MGQFPQKRPTIIGFLAEKTCSLRHPMCFRQPVSSNNNRNSISRQENLVNIDSPPHTHEQMGSMASDGSTMDTSVSPVLQRVAACCSVLQCVAVCCSVLQCGTQVRWTKVSVPIPLQITLQTGVSFFSPYINLGFLLKLLSRNCSILP